MVQKCITFCVDEFLWMLSWGWYQLLFGICFLWFLSVFIGRMKTIRALILTLSSYAFAMFIYFAIVAGFLVNYFQWQFIAGEMPQVFSPLYASFFLGLIYSILQLLFYFIFSYWRTIFIMRFFILSLLSNIGAAIAACCFIKVVF